MKKIINGKTYNTDTAKKLGEWHTSGLSHSDFKYCEEGLYLSRKGQYFVAGSGGAMSKYSVSYGNRSGGSEDIELLTEKEARAWAERYLDADEYLEVFESEEG